ncbi:hypothetical protein BDBG_16887 [Blastomyces gilchristii SLH14081]|uniref:Uncharacterized protein n=1 Tax=Blastomyces gilchristii (strain SLH14081) TaxID=559298 RepID=A0A179UIM0_BLAGS|nr:uncharacterized protein BDBG_16887 [Blastomyces gilchristii SLH14081]OAT07710.1 hypothetical protein BDBG_16887 [Blastomyces gilchristii SLH14081]
MSPRCASAFICSIITDRQYLRVNSGTDQQTTGYDFEAGKLPNSFTTDWGLRCLKLEALELASDIQSDARRSATNFAKGKPRVFPRDVTS